MQKVDEGDLMKRSRYYLSANDMDCIAPSQDFNKLRDSFVIFICLFDPFERRLARYTVRPHCIETGSDVPDGASRLFVNAIAYDACEDARLASFLRYLVTGKIDGDEFCIDVDG